MQVFQAESSSADENSTEGLYLLVLSQHTGSLIMTRYLNKNVSPKINIFYSLFNFSISLLSDRFLIP